MLSNDCLASCAAYCLVPELAVHARVCRQWNRICSHVFQAKIHTEWNVAWQNRFINDHYHAQTYLAFLGWRTFLGAVRFHFQTGQKEIVLTFPFDRYDLKLLVRACLPFHSSWSEPLFDRKMKYDILRTAPHCGRCHAPFFGGARMVHQISAPDSPDPVAWALATDEVLHRTVDALRWDRKMRGMPIHIAKTDDPHLCSKCTTLVLQDGAFETE